MSKRGLAGNGGHGPRYKWWLADGAGRPQYRGVFTEFNRVRQEPGAGSRRWFQGGGLELIVWLDAAGRLEGFQLCYPGELQREHALTWRPAGGFSHARVDAGDTRPDKNLTPILVADGAVPWQKLRREFAAVGDGLEPGLRDFVTARLVEGGR
jgi:hypothetical protein